MPIIRPYYRAGETTTPAYPRRCQCSRRVGLVSAVDSGTSFSRCSQAARNRLINPRTAHLSRVFEDVFSDLLQLLSSSTPLLRESGASSSNPSNFSGYSLASNVSPPAVKATPSSRRPARSTAASRDTFRLRSSRYVHPSEDAVLNAMARLG